MQTNVFAYTANTHPYPEFVSLNENDGKLTLTVRGAARPGQYSDKDCGPDATVELPRNQLNALRVAIDAWLDTHCIDTAL